MTKSSDAPGDTPNDALTVTPRDGGFAAELRGVDLARPLSPEIQTELRQIHWRHPVLSIPGQQLDGEAFLKFANLFGPPDIDIHVQQFAEKGNPALVYLTNIDADGKPDPASAGRGTVWHTDSTYKAAPCAHTVLYALQIPSQGGGTIFADMARAYDALPAETKARIEDLRAVHSFGQGPAEGGIIPLTPEQRKAMPPVKHPIVRTHPHSGRKSLYVNPLHCCGIVGMEDKPAIDLLMDLFEHALQPKFQYHHTWRVGEVVIWDQRCTMHRGAGDAPPNEPRVLMRTKIAEAA